MVLWTNKGIGVKEIQDVVCLNMDMLHIMCMVKGFIDIMQRL